MAKIQKRTKKFYKDRANKFIDEQKKKHTILVKVSDHPLTYKEIEVKDP